ncbi:hypothetical protein CSKR_102396 [Clonorchis sinensis]|uniref:Uncharacterized protein n=1 Tax=Clonorchis sinensis TaxID=79923 RepID=A0A419QEW9_CLOSI|nr:hypothetical protein CSKR_102396 [Clonorchis sinensis]
MQVHINFYGASRHTYFSPQLGGPGDCGARWPKRLECEFTDQKVRGSNPTSASRLPLSRIDQPGSIPALVQPSGGMAVRHRKGATAGRFLFQAHRCSSTKWATRRPSHVSTRTIFEISQYMFLRETTHKAAENSLAANERICHNQSNLGSTFIFYLCMYLASTQETTHKVAENSSTAHDWFRPSWGLSGKDAGWHNHIGSEMAQWLGREFTDRNWRGLNPASASRLLLSRFG